jgi:hypothetical protein
MKCPDCNSETIAKTVLTPLKTRYIIEIVVIDILS